MKKVIIIFLLIQTCYSQNDELKMGKTFEQTTASLYDLSDPNGVNIEVNLWGFVNHPGRYIVPYKSTVVDVLSYSGGPLESSNLKEIRILRPANDSLNSKNIIIKLNYDDLLWGEDISKTKLINPVLQSGDIIIVMEETRYTFRENFLFILPIVTSIVSLATFIITISK